MTDRGQKPTRVLYVSSMLHAPDYAELFQNAPHPPSQATQKYGELLVAGLNAAGAEVVALCAPPVSHRFGARFLHLHRETDAGVRYRYLPVVDLPGIKFAVTWLCAFLWTLPRCLVKRARVLCYGLNVSAAGGARAAARLTRTPASVIVSDVPEQLGGGRLMKIAQRALTAYDGYVLLTEAMNDLVNPHAKPFIVLEGQADARMAARDNPLSHKRAERTVLYAGMLHAKYGVLRLVEAFSSLPGDDIRLVLYGTGDAEDAIRAAAKQDARIEFRGVAENAAVVTEEIAATLLVNPRPSDELFTRFSFPSKNLEYMASGTPLLTTDLPGMPEEYRAYVYLFHDETVAGMAETLKRVLSLPRETLHEKGASAKAFVTAEKSNVAQAKRLLDFLEGLA